MSRLRIGVRAWPFRWLLAGLFVVALTSVASAQSGPTIVRVEEDWELVVMEPDPTTASPQVLCVFSPVGDVESLHASLELNHHSIPAFEPGGMQFEVWEGDVALRERKFPITAIMSTPGEVITWTQSMSLESGWLTFEIKDGSSSTWGSFGGQGYLKPYPVHTTLTDLNGYSTDVSVQSSGVSYAANRVQSLILKRVRLYTSTGEMVEDATPRTVHSLD